MDAWMRKLSSAVIASLLALTLSSKAYAADNIRRLQDETPVHIEDGQESCEEAGEGEENGAGAGETQESGKREVSGSSDGNGSGGGADEGEGSGTGEDEGSAAEEGEGNAAGGDQGSGAGEGQGSGAGEGQGSGAGEGQGSGNDITNPLSAAPTDLLRIPVPAAETVPAPIPVQLLSLQILPLMTKLI